MPELAKVLAFPTAPAMPLSASDIRRAAEEYLATSADSGADSRRSEVVTQPDVLTGVCGLLAESANTSPRSVADEAVALYRCIRDGAKQIGAFDETEYFLGETALLAGTANRVLGQRQEAENWFDRAEAGFRLTVNPSPLLARVTYQRLALRCERGQFQEVAELAPLLATTFSRLKMTLDQAKCVFLEGVALKQACHQDAALSVFASLTGDSALAREPGLTGLAFVNMADIHAAEGRNSQAEECYSDAIPLLQSGKLPAAIAHLHGTFGEVFRRQGKLAEALTAFQAAIVGYETLGMATWVAYLRVVTAQAMLQAGMHREAEWQILAALPTLDEQGMVPEGFAAVSVLRESLRARKADPAALNELREYLQAKN